MLGLALAGGGPASAVDPPREWFEPATGHRVVRLSDAPGSASLYFHQNAYTAAGDKMVISTPEGLATVDLATHRIETVVTGRVSQVVVGPRSRQVFYTKDGTVYATHLDTHVTRAILARPDLRKNAIFGAVEVDLQCFLMGVGLVVHHREKETIEPFLQPARRSSVMTEVSKRPNPKD